MNLRWVHALLILLSAALAVLFGFWCLGLYGREDGVASLLAAVAAFAVSFGLIDEDAAMKAETKRYWWIRRAFTTVAAVMIGGGSSVLACPVCFGAEETSMIDGARLGVLVMLAILFAVQGGFVGFFLYLRKRAKRIADIELDTEWSELQGASRTS